MRDAAPGMWRNGQAELHPKPNHAPAADVWSLNTSNRAAPNGGFRPEIAADGAKHDRAADGQPGGYGNGLSENALTEPVAPRTPNSLIARPGGPRPAPLKLSHFSAS